MNAERLRIRWCFRSADARRKFGYDPTTSRWSKDAGASQQDAPARAGGAPMWQARPMPRRPEGEERVGTGRRGDARAVLDEVLSPHVTLSASEAEPLLDAMRQFSSAASAALLRPGERCRDAFLLRAGLVRTYVVDPDGRERNLRFLAAPNVAVSLASVIAASPSDECVEAVSDVFGWRLPISTIEGSPRGPDLMRLLAEQHYLAMERRVRMLQRTFAKDRYAFYCSHLDPDVVAGMPDYHVASYLGVSPEALSRAKRAARLA